MNPIFIIEHCENCQSHSWNTRHKPMQYQNAAQGIATCIKEVIPDAVVVFNMVPKEFAMSDIYCQLIPNDDESRPFYDVVPRIGALEVSFNGILIFSKCLSKQWPLYPAVAKRCYEVAQSAQEGQDIRKFITTGRSTPNLRSSGRKNYKTQQV